VTIVERDHLPETPEFRRGAPQARHAHTLQQDGQEILEELFPGLTHELAAGGAISLDPGTDLRIFTAGAWHTPRRGNGLASLAFSRPLLEAVLRQRVAGLPGVEFLQGQEAVGLLVDESGERVTGVRLRGRGESNADQTELAADLVVDASGRGSRAAGWLAGLGFTPPRETTVDALTGYASRVYQVPAPSWTPKMAML
jgi:2-polyprenyl-6-methoxyphenol hydroxylase-like FAD-dependent oxidoreductase